MQLSAPYSGLGHDHYQSPFLDIPGCLVDVLHFFDTDQLPGFRMAFGPVQISFPEGQDRINQDILFKYQEIIKRRDSGHITFESRL
jgi:hypothetical protein